MTTSIRYGSYTNAQAVATADAVNRAELALEAVKVISPAIAQNVNANVYTIKSPGSIKAILNMFCTTTAGATKFSGQDQARQPVFTITADGKSVNIAVPNNGTAFANDDLVYLILAVGY